MKTILAATLAAAAALGAAGPSHAAPSHADAYPDKVMWASTETACAKTPGAIGPGLKAEDVATYATTGAVYSATGIRDEYFYGGHRQVKVNGKPCFIDDWSTVVIKGDIDPAAFNSTLLVPDEAHSGVLLAEIGGELTSPTVHAMPSGASSTLGELETGDIVLGADWQVEGVPSITGRAEWLPISWAGTLAWIPAASVARVPTYDPADLTGQLTPEHEMTVYAAPTSSSEPVGSASTGETVPASSTAWAGWIPVAVDGRVGWVSQGDLVAPAPSPSASASPTPTEGEEGVIDKAKDKWDKFQDEREAAATERGQTGEPGFIESLKNRVTGSNPVAEAAAKLSVRFAGILALVALLLAGGAHMATRMVGSQKGLLAKAASAVAPGNALLVHATLPAAAAIGVWAAMAAPNEYYVPQVLAGAAVGGGVLAYVTAHRVAAMRGADRTLLVARARERSTALLLVVLGVGAGLQVVTGASLAVCVVASLLTAGASAGLQAKKTQAEAPPPAHLTNVPVDSLDG